MKKFAISLPNHQAAAVEKIRRKMRIPRSRVIQSAIDRYLVLEGLSDEIRRYADGYRRRPERAEAVGYAKAAAAALAQEKWK